MPGVKRTDGNLMMLCAVYLAALFIANSGSSKFVIILGHTLPSSTIMYPMTLMVLCVISELWDRRETYRLVMLGLSTKFVGVVLLGLAQLCFRTFPRYGGRHDLWWILGTSIWDVSGRMVLGSDIRIWATSIVSFALAQFSGATAFNALRDRHIRKHGGPWGGRWLRYLAGSMTGELVEVLVFMALCYPSDLVNVPMICVIHLYVRGALTLALMPVFYILTWRRRGNAQRGIMAHD